ncbi:MULTISPECIES: hypothetical protein [unclassified Microcoleus]|uniref:hypothetical protein n=1 Tax=unclassified Microcoleus TaxID=2642155 RepID=UPI002FCFBFCA
MTDRVQLNLRLDGRRDLLETIKEVAAAQGLSVNAWVVRTLETAANSSATPITKSELLPEPMPAIRDIEPVLDILLDGKLDTLLAAKFAGIEERLGKLSA